MSDNTLEQIAREAAESLVKTRRIGPGGEDARIDYGVTVGTDAASVTAWQGYERRATDVACAVTGEIRCVVLAALDRARTACPVPGGLSDERLAEIQAATDEFGYGIVGTPITATQGIDLYACLQDQHKHIEFLTALLRDAAADGVLARLQGLRERYFREGALAQRLQDVMNLSVSSSIDVNKAVTLLEAAPLATPDAAADGAPDRLHALRDRYFREGALAQREACAEFFLGDSEDVPRFMNTAQRRGSAKIVRKAPLATPGAAEALEDSSSQLAPFAP